MVMVAAGAAGEGPFGADLEPSPQTLVEGVLDTGEDGDLSHVPIYTKDDGRAEDK